MAQKHVYEFGILSDNAKALQCCPPRSGTCFPFSIRLNADFYHLDGGFYSLNFFLALGFHLYAVLSRRLYYHLDERGVLLGACASNM